MLGFDFPELQEALDHDDVEALKRVELHFFQETKHEPGHPLGGMIFSIILRERQPAWKCYRYIVEALQYEPVTRSGHFPSLLFQALGTEDIRFLTLGLEIYQAHRPQEVMSDELRPLVRGITKLLAHPNHGFGDSLLEIASFLSLSDLLCAFDNDELEKGEIVLARAVLDSVPVDELLPLCRQVPPGLKTEIERLYSERIQEQLTGLPEAEGLVRKTERL